MELAGHILLGLIGVLMIIVCVVGIYKAGFVINVQHVTFFIVSVGCILLAFFPVSKFSMGATGISAELERQKKTIEVMRTVLESSGSAEQRSVISAVLGEGEEWTSVANIPPSRVMNNLSDGGAGDLIRSLAKRDLIETRIDGGNLSIRSK